MSTAGDVQPRACEAGAMLSRHSVSKDQAHDLHKQKQTSTHSRPPTPHLHSDGAGRAVCIAAHPRVGVLYAEHGIRLQYKGLPTGNKRP